MIFHEIYGAYYRAVANILKKAAEAPLTEAQMRQIATEDAFPESALEIVPALTEGRWALLNRDLTTPLRVAEMPVSTLEKRWLKAISLDPRVRLFGEIAGVEDIEPLFLPEDILYFDRYADGDDYTDEGYIARFRLILAAQKEGRAVSLRFTARSGRSLTVKGTPVRILYSEKDDKFRVQLVESGNGKLINLGRVTDCKLLDVRPASRAERPPVKKQCVLEVRDERNTLERFLLAFVHLEKNAERTEDGKYRVTLCYEGADETEVVVGVLGFGPFVKAVAPEPFVELIKDRLRKQLKLKLK